MRLFLKFITHQAPAAEALYILGDLFDYWAGDDDLDVHTQQIVSALRALADRGTAIYFMHGNRDFLIGQAFADATGVRLLPDPVLINLYGRPALLTHGDILCTDDVEYQKFRKQVRNPVWQQTFLTQPLQQRKAQIEALRQRSEQEKSGKAASIMDANPAAIEATLRIHDYPELLIHGHTHRPARHSIVIDSHVAERIVLADWGPTTSYLACDSDGCSVVPITA